MVYYENTNRSAYILEVRRFCKKKEIYAGSIVPFGFALFHTHIPPGFPEGIILIIG